MKQVIDVIVGVDGNAKINVNGVKGNKCVELTAGLAKALGKTIEWTATNEMYDNPVETQAQIGQV